MGELIRIGAQEGDNGLAATVDTGGAWVVDLSLDGRPILFRRDTLQSDTGQEMTRGGMHVCSPYFGSPWRTSTLGLPKHGYSRLVDWKEVEITEDAVTLEHAQGRGHYVGLEQTLTYAISETPEDGEFEFSFTADLTLRNCRPPRRVPPIVVAPGFHPYFQGLEGFEDLKTDVVRSGEVKTLGGGFTTKRVKSRMGRDISVSTRNLPEFIEWTDRLGDYVCIEPTASGNKIDAATDGVQILQAGRSYGYLLEIAVGRA